MAELTITKECIQCHKNIDIETTTEAYNAWREGALIQNAMPNLSADERELLMSGICGTCFDKIFQEVL